VSSDASRTIRAIFRIESPKLIAVAARIVRDVGVAEELVQDALLAALEQWPDAGIPDNPGAWLMTAAKNRALNVVERRRMLERKHREIARDADDRHETDVEAAMDDDIGDDLLRLVFTACHPVLSTEGRVALTLRMLGGLTTDEIARAFLVPESTISQRIVRAKRTLADKKVPFEVPHGSERDERLSSVLSVIYLIFNEGYSASSGSDVMRPALAEDALRLGRILAELAREEPEVHGLLALMEINASRAAARTDASGEPILLLDQNRAKWDRLAILRGLAAIERADALGRDRGPYLLQARIAACHARARVAADTDWTEIASLYGELASIARSPIVELNRAVAISMAQGPEAGLAILDALAGEPALEGYPLLPSARADMLEKLGRTNEARAQWELAASLTENAPRRQRLLARAAKCDSEP
jgi:RNA polymerase sigma-70 factor, ECF subfamily